MTTPPPPPPPSGNQLPEPKPGKGHQPADQQPEGHQPEDRLEFALGPKANPDGTPLDPDETRRRLAAQRWLLEQLAAQHGLEVREVGQHPPSEQVPTARANRIKQAAQPEMDTAADATTEKRNGLNFSAYSSRTDECGDRRIVERKVLGLELTTREGISDIIKSLAGIAKSTLPVGKVAVGIKVGWLKLVAMARHDGDTQSDQRDAD